MTRNNPNLQQIALADLAPDDMLQLNPGDTITGITSFDDLERKIAQAMFDRNMADTSMESLETVFRQVQPRPHDRGVTRMLEGKLVDRAAVVDASGFEDITTNHKGGLMAAVRNCLGESALNLTNRGEITEAIMSILGEADVIEETFRNVGALSLRISGVLHLPQQISGGISSKVQFRNYPREITRADKFNLSKRSVIHTTGQRAELLKRLDAATKAAEVAAQAEADSKARRARAFTSEDYTELERRDEEARAEQAEIERIVREELGE